jgi:hypothetical protein
MALTSRQNVTMSSKAQPVRPSAPCGAGPHDHAHTLPSPARPAPRRGGPQDCSLLQPMRVFLGDIYLVFRLLFIATVTPVSAMLVGNAKGVQVRGPLLSVGCRGLARSVQADEFLRHWPTPPSGSTPDLRRPPASYPFRRLSFPASLVPSLALSLLPSLSLLPPSLPLSHSRHPTPCLLSSCRLPLA